MSASKAVIHSVHFYDADDALIQRLQSLIASSVDAGNAALIVATDAHRTQLSEALKKRGLDIYRLEKSGTISFFNAHETLTHFMVNGLPDRERFFASVGSLVTAAKETARNASRGLTVFGEMVAVLWEQGNKVGALQLETLWNELLNDRAFHLHCAYPRSLFADGTDVAAIEAVCGAHSHVIGNGVN